MEGIDKSVFNYELPKRLIAQEPLAERAASRLLVLNGKTGEITHALFKSVINYINPGDCIVLNDTKVMPARLMGVKTTPNTGALIELLLLKRLGGNVWETLVKPAKRMKSGDIVSFGDGLLTGRVTGVFDDGIRHVELVYEGVFEEILDKLGEAPLPPYITHKLDDRSRYQTVYAEKTGSAAAPTAGLHFTEEMLRQLSEKGVKTAKITLHVGLGTFRPVKTDNILEHKMHSEYYMVDSENADIINSAKKAGGKIICVGTTTVRTLESIASESGEIAPSQGETDIFIYPGYKFKIADMLITNFHIPESTLMALVCAFAGTENVLRAYREAVEKEYRFYSFGDACLLL